MNANTTDVLIVGGGPAGLATGIALRRRGVGCVVVDARAPGMDKACGEGLMPGTLASLATLGVEVTAADGFPFCGIRFENAEHRVDARFPVGAGVGVRRPTLHRKLAERAQTLGVDARWESRVKLLGRGQAEVNGRALRFGWLVGADGQASGVRRWAGLDRVRSEGVRYGARRHYRVRPWSEFVENHWGEGRQLYVTPVGPECVCVVLIARERALMGEELLEGFPELQRRLGGAESLGPRRGGVSTTRKLRRVANDWVALVGDASGSADSITGEGLAMSFRQAEAVAEAIGRGSLAGYGRAHARIGRLPHTMGALMLTMDRWPGLERRVLRTFAGEPELFGELLKVHVGARSLPGFAAGRGLGLVWGLLKNGTTKGRAFSDDEGCLGEPGITVIIGGVKAG